MHERLPVFPKSQAMEQLATLKSDVIAGQADYSPLLPRKAAAQYCIWASGCVGFLMIHLYSLPAVQRIGEKNSRC